MKVSLKEYFNLLSKYLKSQINSVIILATVLAGNIILQLANPQILRYFLDEATKGDTARRLTIAAIIFIGKGLI